MFLKSLEKCTCKNYKWDPFNYFSSPEIRWDAMLKIMDVELDLNSDTDMNHFIEKDMKEGVNYSAQRYSKANNTYMKFYDKNEMSKHIYLDANNFYEWTMTQIFLKSGIKWLSQKRIDRLDVNKKIQ